MSLETTGSSVTCRIPLYSGLLAASFKALSTSSTLTSRFRRNVKSDKEPTGTGTRIASPLKIPLSGGNASAAAMVAPVEVGTILRAAARARL